MNFVSLKDLILDLIFPPRCAGCLDLLPIKQEDIFCPKCRKEWELYKKEKCRRCGQPIESCWCGIPFDKDGVITSEHHLVQYHKNKNSVIKCLVYYMKRRNNKKVFDAIAREMYIQHYSKLELNDPVICYIPRSPRNIRRFGHDQALNLASAFADLTGLEITPVLIHEGSTNQKTLDPKQREYNAKKSYQIINGAGKLIKGKTVILIDDILTTGSSATRCAKLLKWKGANKIIVFTVAKSM